MMNSDKLDRVHDLMAALDSDVLETMEDLLGLYDFLQSKIGVLPMASLMDALDADDDARAWNIFCLNLPNVKGG